MFLLDTNVISELRKPEGRVAPEVVQWVSTQSSTSLYVSMVTLYELEVGVRRLARRDDAGGRRLRRWIDDQFLQAFADRLLLLDADVARQAAALQVPYPRPERDMYIAATALVHGMTLVTRNVNDFASTGVALLDPWHV